MQTLQFLLFGPGIRWVPDVVWKSPYFWILLVAMIAFLLFRHNNPLFFKRLFHSNVVSGAPDGARILYSGDGRGGYVHYQSPETKFAMYYEFGGGDCVAGIQIPAADNWEKETGLPLANRDAVLDFIGRQVVKDQTTLGKGHFKIEGDWLNIYT